MATIEKIPPPFKRWVIAGVFVATLGGAFPARALEPPLPYHQNVALEATVKLVMNGCWVLATKVGRLEAVNLDAKFKIDGLKVSVTVRPEDGIASTCGVGVEIVTVLYIAKVDAEK